MKISPKLTQITALGLICVGYGILVGFLSIGSVRQPDYHVDELPYQNFTLAAGAIIALAIFAIAYAFYLVARR